jgi:hypothetical protein
MQPTRENDYRAADFAVFTAGGRASADALLMLASYRTASRTVDATRIVNPSKARRSRLDALRLFGRTVVCPRSVDVMGFLKFKCVWLLRGLDGQVKLTIAVRAA